MGWFLPAPMGLLPAFIAFVLAISVSRLWGWVEEDRALAAMTQYRSDNQYKVGFKQDYRDETLLGFIFVFSLVPIIMMQLHVGKVFGPALFKNADTTSFLPWFGYFGTELAKAVPIVDWAEIYGVKATDKIIAMNGAASKHAVFVARVMIDTVLIAALLQAISIATRNRQQKQLYKTEKIDRVDEIVERREMAKAIAATEVDEPDPKRKNFFPENVDHHFDLSRLRDAPVMDFRRYAADRLRVIFYSTKNPRKRDFITAIAHQRKDMSLRNAIDLVREIAHSHKNEYELINTFARAQEEHRSNINRYDAEDIFDILNALRESAGLKDFKFELIDRLKEIATPDTAVDYLMNLAGGKTADAMQYARNRAIEVVAELVDRIRDGSTLGQLENEISEFNSAERHPVESRINRAAKAVKMRLEQLNADKARMSTLPFNEPSGGGTETLPA